MKTTKIDRTGNRSSLAQVSCSLREEFLSPEDLFFCRTFVARSYIHIYIYNINELINYIS